MEKGRREGCKEGGPRKEGMNGGKEGGGGRKKKGN